MSTRKEQEGNLTMNDTSTSIHSCCCVLCYCAVDFSDLAYFSQQARDEDIEFQNEYYPNLLHKETEDPPTEPKPCTTTTPPLLLPMSLYDPDNALVFCDSCDRAFHQRCHFVPTLHLPRGEWHCFICTSTPKLLSLQKMQQLQHQQKRKTRKTKKMTTNTLADITSSKFITWTKNLIKTQIYTKDKPAGPIEAQWEYDVQTLKPPAFTAEIKRLEGAISQQLQKIRLAQMAMKAYTHTSRRQVSWEAIINSQELCQALYTLSSAKLRIRQLLQSLDTYLRDDDTKWNTLLQFCHDNPTEWETWFPPLGGISQLPSSKQIEDTNGTKKSMTTFRRIVPRLKDDMLTNHDNKNPNNNNDDDDDSGLSLDDLQCAVCFRGDATDDNDVLLCDGEGCFRAYHMQCLSPVVTPEAAEAQEDWFCPICTSLANVISKVHSEYTGDEWYDEDDEDKNVKQNNDEDDGANHSVTSWQNVQHVFPEADDEYQVACQWKNSKHSLSTTSQSYLKQLLGYNQLILEWEDNIGFHNDNPQDDDDNNDEEEEEDDDDFDPKNINDDDDEKDASHFKNSSTAINNGGIVTMDSQSLNSDDDDDDIDSWMDSKISRGELDALSSSGGSIGDDESNQEKNHEGGTKSKDDSPITRRRPKRRTTRQAYIQSNVEQKTPTTTMMQQRKNTTTTTTTTSWGGDDVGKLDTSNILIGKRRRRTVDYALLNDSMFGNTICPDIDDDDDHDHDNDDDDDNDNDHAVVDNDDGMELQNDETMTSNRITSSSTTTTRATRAIKTTTTTTTTTTTKMKKTLETNTKMTMTLRRKKVIR